MKGWERHRFERQSRGLMVVLLLSPVALIIGAVTSPGPWLWIPGLGTLVLLFFVGMIVWALLVDTRDRKEKLRAEQELRRAPRRRRNIFAITRDIPGSVTLTTDVGDLTQQWADTMAPDDFSAGRFENRLEGFVGKRRASNSEPTRFTAFEHVDSEGWRRWYLTVPLRGPLPPLDVLRVRGAKRATGFQAGFRTGDEHIDRVYRIAAWDPGAEGQAYLAAFFVPEILAQMREVAFEWRVRGRLLVAHPRVSDTAKAVAYAQNLGTQLALIADKVPDQVYARYANWYHDNGAAQGLANPDDLR